MSIRIATICKAVLSLPVRIAAITTPSLIAIVAERRDGELAAEHDDHRDDTEERQASEVREENQRRHHEKLVRQRVEELPKHADLAPLAGEVAVDEVGERGPDVKHRRPEARLGCAIPQQPQHPGNQSDAEHGQQVGQIDRVVPDRCALGRWPLPWGEVYPRLRASATEANPPLGLNSQPALWSGARSLHWDRGIDTLRATETCMLELTRNVADRARTTLGVTAQNLATQDVIALAFHAYLFLRVSIAPDSPDATVARRLALALFGHHGVLAGAGPRRGDSRPTSPRSDLSPGALHAPMVLSYFQMRVFAPGTSARSHGPSTLYAIDLWLLGTTPAVWMEALERRAGGRMVVLLLLHALLRHDPHAGSLTFFSSVRGAACKS